MNQFSKGHVFAALQKCSELYKKHNRCFQVVVVGVVGVVEVEEEVVVVEVEVVVEASEAADMEMVVEEVAVIYNFLSAP